MVVVMGVGMVVGTMMVMGVGTIITCRSRVVMVGDGDGGG